MAQRLLVAARLVERWPALRRCELISPPPSATAASSPRPHAARAAVFIPRAKPWGSPPRRDAASALPATPPTAPLAPSPTPPRRTAGRWWCWSPAATPSRYSPCRRRAVPADLGLPAPTGAAAGAVGVGPGAPPPASALAARLVALAPASAGPARAGVDGAGGHWQASCDAARTSAISARVVGGLMVGARAGYCRCPDVPSRVALQPSAALERLVAARLSTGRRARRGELGRRTRRSRSRSTDGDPRARPR